MCKETVLEDIIESVYGVNPLYAESHIVVWALDKFCDKTLAKEELSILNCKRTKAGIIPVYVPFGHYAF